MVCHYDSPLFKHRTEGSLPKFHCFISYFKVLLCKRKGNQDPILAKFHLTTYRTRIYCIALNLRFILLTVLSLSLIPDIDECSLNTHDCDSRSERRTCTNTPGSFTCGCQSGYQLAPNKKTCNGEGIETESHCTWITDSWKVYKQQINDLYLLWVIFQMWMNVLVVMDVHKSVKTRLVDSNVSVRRGINWRLTRRTVWVRKRSYLLCTCTVQLIFLISI